MRNSYSALLEGMQRQRESILRGRHKNEYAEFLARGLEKNDDGFWMPTPVPPSIGLKNVFHLAILMDFQMRYRPDAEAKNNGWFHCSVEEMEEKNGDLGLYATGQTRAFRKLEKLGLVKRKVTGKPPQRFVWINYDLFVEKFTDRIMELQEQEAISKVT